MLRTLFVKWLAAKEMYMKKNVGIRYRGISLLFFFVLLFPWQLFAATGSPVDVFVSIPPQRWLCRQLAGDQVTVHLLVDKGQEPHAFEPTPRQIQALSRSVLFFTAGLEFEHEITRRLKSSSPNLRIVDTSNNIEKIPMKEAVHEHGGMEVLDPHVWLSPPNLKSMAEVMLGSLVRVQPGNERLYRDNFQRLSRELDALDSTVLKELASYGGASFFVFHPAFGYFAHRYNLHQVAVETGGKSPTPRQLFALIRKARADGVKVVFVQPQFDPSSAESIARAIDGKVVALDPLAENSVESIRIMAEKIASALGGPAT